jgi:UMF1 family MFS transporter
VAKLRKLTRPEWSWALYDTANSGYALCILAGFYPILFKDFWGQDLDDATQTRYFTTTVASAGLLVAILAPFLGSLAENWGGRKRMLMAVTTTGALAAALLALPGGGGWLQAGLTYVVATVSFYACILFYDALLPDVAKPGRRHIISGVGYAFGYGGSLLLFLFCSVMVSVPEWFGLPGSEAAMRVSFVLVALWWAAFALPMFLLFREPERPRPPLSRAVSSSLRSLARTAREIIATPRVFWFLLAYWFYIDGVHTLITTATNFGTQLGLGKQHLLGALVTVQLTGGFSAYFMGRAGQRFGPRLVISSLLVVYLGVAGLGANLRPEPWDIFGMAFHSVFLMAALIGLAQGGVQVLSRSYYANIVPPERSAAFFGFYNMLGRSAAILGPVLIGAVTEVTGNVRFGILSVGVLFLIGLVLLHIAGRRARAGGWE